LNGRRRNPRYRVSKAFEGVLQTLTDVVLEFRDGPYLVALSDIAMKTGLSLALDVFVGPTRRTIPVTVAESSPVIHGGVVRYRLRLATDGLLDAIDPDGLLVMETPVRVLDMSQNGFLLETSRQSDAGTVGLLRVDVEGRAYEGEVRVVRCNRLEGAADRHRVGAEFLRTRRVPHGSPLRNAFFAMMKTANA
jgi:PilZ domain-containing protein